MSSSGLSLSTSIPTNKQQTYLFANQCDLEIYCSPFGVSAIYVNIPNSDILGIGSTMGKLTGKTKGRLYYNNGEDFKNKKFKIHGMIDEDDMLRIDFFKIFQNETEDFFLGKQKDKFSQKASVDSKDNSKEESGGSNFTNGSNILNEQSSSMEYAANNGNSSNSNNSQNYESNSNSNTDNIQSQSQRSKSMKTDDLEIPDIIFKGACPECRPTKVDPFIGVFSFENRDAK